jgi:hypothetical protein
MIPCALDEEGRAMPAQLGFTAGQSLPAARA